MNATTFLVLVFCLTTVVPFSIDWLVRRFVVIDYVSIVTFEPKLAAKLNSGELRALVVVHPPFTPRVAQPDPGVVQ